MTFQKIMLNAAIKYKPDIAVNDQETAWTYHKILDLAAGLNSIEDKKLVLIRMEKSADMTAAILALSLSKHSFIPVPFDLPVDRAQYILKDSQANLVLFNQHNDLDTDVDQLDIYNINTNLKFSLIENSPDELFYMIYTSGSTGKPKGVKLSQRGLSFVIPWQVKTFEMDREKSFSWLSYSFDASLSDIYTAFLSGSCLFINEPLKIDLRRLSRWFDEIGITYTDMPPSILPKFLEYGKAQSLKTIVTGGDIANIAAIREASEIYNIFNLYGPTEATICSSIKKCDPEWEKGNIGQPGPGFTYSIANNEEEGELIIGGEAIAIGYKNTDKINQARFKKANGQNVYYTGDIVRQKANGDWVFIGRTDRQIKHHGRLVNLEEIEVALKENKDVADAACIYVKGRITAYIETRRHASERQHIKKLTMLPSWMHPSMYHISTRLPRTASGKIDRKKLEYYWNLDNDYTDLGCPVQMAFAEALGTYDIDEFSDFFTHGGDSLSLIDLQLLLEKSGYDIDLADLPAPLTPWHIINSNNGHQHKQVHEYWLSVKPKPVDLTYSRSQNEKTHLVTGGTGFLGSTLIPEILKNTDTVICLCRDNDADRAKSRITKSIQKYTGKNKVDSNRIITIPGNISSFRFGLDKKTWDKLTNTVTDVWHCAANVNNALPFQELINDNVDGVINIADFCESGPLKKLHYASTLSVYVSQKNSENLPCLDTKPLSLEIPEFHHGYAASKYLAELYLQERFKDCHNLNIARFGLLTGATNVLREGEGSFLPSFIRLASQEKTMPVDDINMSVDITPVDIAVKNWIESQDKKICHISCNYRLKYKDIIQKLNKPLVNKMAWNGSSDIRNMLPLLFNNNRMMWKNIFEMSNINKMQTSMDEAVINKNYIKKYIQYSCDTQSWQGNHL